MLRFANELVASRWPISWAEVAPPVRGRAGETHQSEDGRALRPDPYTRLRGPGRRNFFYLYVLVDLFSGYVPGWMLASVERAELARRLIDETVARHDLDPTGLTIHSDHGVPAAKPAPQLLATLEITQSVTRPRTPNDNPYSESQFRTMKYRPQFPASFAGIDDARGFCVDFFGWHNFEHRHSGIGFHTPASVYHGTATEIRHRRAHVLNHAFASHPERRPSTATAQLTGS